MNKNKLFSDGTLTVDLENGIDDLHYKIKEKWSCNPSQIKYRYDEENKYWRVYLTNKLGETFAMIGAINFNPNEN